MQRSGYSKIIAHELRIWCTSHLRLVGWGIGSLAYRVMKTKRRLAKSSIAGLSVSSLELGLPCITISSLLSSWQRWAASLVHYWSLATESKVRVEDGERDGHKMRGEQGKEACKGELYGGPEGRRGQIVGKKAWDDEEKKEDRNNEGWKESGDKGGIEDREGAAKRALSGAEEALGPGDCCAFILLCSRLLKHYLRKRL